MCRLEEPGIKHHLSYSPGLFFTSLPFVTCTTRGTRTRAAYAAAPSPPVPSCQARRKSHQGLHERAATGGFSVRRAALSAHGGAFQRDGRPRGIFVMGFINKCTDLLNLSGCRNKPRKREVGFLLRLCDAAFRAGEAKNKLNTVE